MKSRSLFILAFLLSCSYGEEEFRRATLTEVGVAHAAYRVARAARAAEDIAFFHARQAVRSADAKFALAVRAKWRASIEKTCQADARLREIVTPIENKVSERYGGKLPDWLTQSRDWRQIHEHLTERKHRLATVEECPNMGGRL